MGLTAFSPNAFLKYRNGVFTGTMATMESEPVCHETARAPDSFSQNRFTGVRQVKPANDGSSFLREIPCEWRRGRWYKRA